MKLNTKYTVILLPAEKPYKTIDDSLHGICFDSNGDNPAYFNSEQEAQALVDEMINYAPQRKFYIGTITFYTPE